MKKKQNILLFLIAIIFISCSKDDTSAPVPVFNISGNWILTDYYFNGSRRILDDISVNTITFSATAWELNVETIFSETPNDYKSSGFYNLDITITDENGGTTFFVNTLHIDDAGTWSRNNTFLGITVNNALTQASISVLNDTTLMYVISSQTNETDENNQNVSVFRTDFYTYTRQTN